jgi:glycosyltransferase involved in cell wall biosynthesis
MKTSVVVITHNEEKYISGCISSILNQTKKPDEVVVLVHNSTDKTLEITKSFPVKVIELGGKAGPVYARIEGIKNVSGDIILCIDGDSIAKSNWIEIMGKTLENNNNVLVGSWIKKKGTNVEALSNIWNKYFCVSINNEATKWLWGGSFAFWGKDKNYVLETFEKNIEMSKELKLSGRQMAEDYWLALSMNKIGNLEIINKTWVTTNTKESSSMEVISRSWQNVRNGHLMKNCFEKNNA